MEKNYMAPDENKKNRIMDYAFKKFSTLSITQVTMDDIARGVGIGKGTLYKLFPSKDALVLSTVDYFTSNIDSILEEIVSDENMTPIEKLSLFLKIVAQKLSLISPQLFTSLERNMPEAYEKIESNRQRIIMTNLVKLLQEGKKSGLYDPKMDEFLTAHIVIGASRYIIQAHVLTTLDYTLDQAFKFIISVILKGCLTEEGRKQVLQTL